MKGSIVETKTLHQFRFVLLNNNYEKMVYFLCVARQV